MKKYFILLLLMLSGCLMADEIPIALEKAEIHLQDKKSIIRGAKFFAANCMACHTLIYLRYNELARDAGITYEKMPIHVKSWPFDIKPPDLSLTANVRGVDWIYTYLHSFYVDPARPTGFNNLLIANTAMTDILVGYQGRQILVNDAEGSRLIFSHEPQWYDKLVLQSSGSMTPKEFDETIKDVVNFLAYAAQPYYDSEVKIGYGVIGFLLLFFMLTYFLKKEYWRNIKNK